MTKKINTIEKLIQQLNPYQLVDYLRKTGWRKYKFSNEEIAIYQYVDGNKFYQVNIPLTKDFSDYQESLLRALEEVSRKEERSKEEILFFLLNREMDRLDIFFQGNNVQNLGLPISATLEVLEVVRKFIISSIQKTITSQNKNIIEINEVIYRFLNRCYVKQKDEDSHIISIFFPFDDLKNNKNLQSDNNVLKRKEENIFIRQVTTNLMEDLLSLRRYLDQNVHNNENINKKIYRVFDDLKGLKLNVDLKFNIKWSSLIHQDNQIDQILFYKKDNEKIQHIIKIYKQYQTREMTKMALVSNNKSVRGRLPYLNNEPVHIKVKYGNAAGTRHMRKMVGGMLRPNKKIDSIVRIDNNNSSLSKLFKISSNLLFEKEGPTLWRVNNLDK